ncbi:hypothetical protein GCM10010260_77680 [Streptomyces filipinensis]|uniref:Uncharacterized protein n=1 Tax=Streptomyces filipinensis TaxID=66887 RepID=A0A918IJ53_9ACTN|nr:hypothetical protein GCM10010260_77680 [Streptomyces filipinensis]
MFHLSDFGRSRKPVISRRFAGLLLISRPVAAADLVIRAGNGRPNVIGVFHEAFRALEGAHCGMPRECAAGNIPKE